MTMTDQEITALLPWYINQTLSPKECEAVEALLERSSDARAQEQFLRVMSEQVKAETPAQVSELGWRRLQRDMRKQGQGEARQREWWKPGLAAAAAVIVVLQLGLFIQTEQQTSTRLLSGQVSAVDQQENWVLQLKLVDTGCWQDVVIMLASIDAKLVDGPSSIGLVRVAVPATSSRFASADALEAWLLQQPLVEHASTEGQ